ncbi:MAG: rubredoxin [Methanogenium sp.]|nr:rubredoxin [Methanogenium sp.]
MKQYKCTKCGYIYLPAIGDQTQNIRADTPFDDLPDTWVCPRCGVDKNEFVMIE